MLIVLYIVLNLLYYSIVGDMVMVLVLYVYIGGISIICLLIYVILFPK